jgi:inward rectifier potassium channel
MGKKIKAERDLGFGTKPTASGQRMLNQDGSFNVIRKGESRFPFYNLYHSLITMRWGRFILLVLGYYTLMNLFFALIYFAVGTHQLAGIIGNSPYDRIFETFFFSAQTLTTVGYGRISPVGHVASIIASLESFMGLMGFALATGLLYARFARPDAKLSFSHNVLVAPYMEGKALMFRIANKRSNQLIEVEVQVNCGYRTVENGKEIRKFINLDLERSKINFLPLSWTIVHPIDETSMFHNKTKKELEEQMVELIILVKAFDDTFSQTVHSRTSYKLTEFVWDAKFRPMFENDGKGQSIMHMNRINDHEVLA